MCHALRAAAGTSRQADRFRRAALGESRLRRPTVAAKERSAAPRHRPELVCGDGEGRPHGKRTNGAVGLAVRQRRTLGRARPRLKGVVRRHSAHEGSRPAERGVDTDHVSALSCEHQSVVAQRPVQLGSPPSMVIHGLEHHRARGLGLSRTIDTGRSHTVTMPDVSQDQLCDVPSTAMGLRQGCGAGARYP